MSFEWHTEEEQNSVGLPSPAVSTGSASGRGRRWLLLLVALLLGTIIWAGQRRAQQYVAGVEAAETEALLASERLAQRAADAGDKELLKTILSGRDPAWVREQYRLLAEGSLLQESGRVLGFRPEPGEPVALDVTFDSRLATAEVVVAHTYIVTDAGGVPAPVTLSQQRLYRRGRERWLLAPPLPAFWGERQTLRTRYLALAYPERDEAVASRLADDLNGIIAEICTMPEITCPSNFRMRLHLEPETEGLVRRDATMAFWRTAGDLNLPAPSLIGTPQDEAAYQALLRAYAAPVVEVAITELIGYQCCTHALLYRALLDWQLSQLGLRAWPVGPDEQASVVDFLERPGQLQALWEMVDPAAATPVERAEAYVTVAQLASLDGGMASGLLRSMDGAGTMARWVRGMGGYASLTEFMNVMRRSLIAQINKARPSPSLPGQDLLASCRAGAFARLYRYDLAADRWRPLGDGNGGLVGNGSVVRAVGLDDHGHFTTVWEREQWIELHPMRGGDFLLGDMWQPETVDPAGQYLPAYLRGVDGRTVLAVLADLERCTANGCFWLSLPTFPLWSPEGGALLWEEKGVLWRQERETLGEGHGRPVGIGSFPFWLDEERYGYVQDGTLMVATIAGDRAQPAFSLTSLLSREGDFEVADLADVVNVPQRGGVVALFVDAPDKGEGAILLVELAHPEVVTSLPLPVENGRRIFSSPFSSFSPDGRWLIVHTSASVTGERGEFLLVDLNTGRQVLRILAPWWVQPGFRPAQQFAWSADGHWLARIATHQIDLLVPQADGIYRRYLLPPDQFPGGGACEAVGWIASLEEQ